MDTETITCEDILLSAPKPFSTSDRKRIEEAFQFAQKAHEGQLRRSGIPYVTHTIATARILASIGMDASTVIAGLVHDVPEDTPVPLSDIEEKFGSTVAHIVDGITKLGKIKLRGSKEEYFLENLRKMFLAMAEDIRVVIVKLADRLHNMQTLDALPKEKQLRIAQETMDVYAPIANRLGIGEIKGELEDLAFKYLDPKNHTITKDISDTYIREGQADLDHIVTLFKKELREENIHTITISGRKKHLYRLFLKLKSHDMDIKRVHDDSKANDVNERDGGKQFAGDSRLDGSVNYR
jgi:GTP pyrophosphokinase